MRCENNKKLTIVKFINFSKQPFVMKRLTLEKQRVKTVYQIIDLYLIPALRRVATKALVSVDKRLTQKQIAELLGITTPAVNQYLKNKRSGLKLPLHVKKSMLRDLTLLSSVNGLTKRNVFQVLQKHFLMLVKNDFLCTIHKDVNPDVDDNDCKLCVVQLLKQETTYNQSSIVYAHKTMV